MLTCVYRRRSESPPHPTPAYDGYQGNGYVSGSAGPPSVPPPRRDYPPPRNNRDIIEPVGNYRRT